MTTTTIAAPSHWSDADTCDIERELIGLIIEQQGLDDSARIIIIGVRKLGYHAPSRADWTSVRSSRAIRQGRAMEVQYTIEAPKPATTAAEYLEATRDANKARELHPSDLGNIDLDSFQLMTPDGRRQTWAAASDDDRRGLALQIIRRQGHGPDAATINLFLAELDARFGPSPIERAVAGALEQMADTHQRSHETAETKEERTYFSRWAGAFRKALYFYSREGVRPEQTESGAWLVPSATRTGRVHSVARDGRCSCEAQGRGCWHAALCSGIETAYDGLGQADDGDEPVAVEEPEGAAPEPPAQQPSGADARALAQRIVAARARIAA
jgi:hypothetical protein